MTIERDNQLDPVCGTVVDLVQAAVDGLTVEHENRTYYFCGRGCKLDFLEDPDKYLDPDYKPSM